MPRGAPDYGIYEKPAIALPILWQDDFEAPVLRWTTASSLGSPNPVLSQVEQWKGVQSVYFATVLGAGEYSNIEKNFPLIRLGRIGVEFFILLENRTPGYMQIIANILDGVNASQADLRLDRQARTASIVTPVGTFVIATNCFPTIPNRVWTPFKMVVDMSTDLYTRLFVGDRAYDISNHALIPAGLTTNRWVNLHIRLQGDAGGARDAYLDNFVLTQNEP